MAVIHVPAVMYALAVMPKSLECDLIRVSCWGNAQGWPARRHVLVESSVVAGARDDHLFRRVAILFRCSVRRSRELRLPTLKAQINLKGDKEREDSESEVAVATLSDSDSNQRSS